MLKGYERLVMYGVFLSLFFLGVAWGMPLLYSLSLILGVGAFLVVRAFRGARTASKQKDNGAPISRVAGLRWLWISAIVVILAQGVSLLAGATVLTDHSLELLPSLRLELAHRNALGIEGIDSKIADPIAVAVLAVFVVWLSFQGSCLTWISVGIALVVGGGMNILVDRILEIHRVALLALEFDSGSVMFGISDIAIIVGLVMIALGIIRRTSVSQT